MWTEKLTGDDDPLFSLAQRSRSTRGRGPIPRFRLFSASFRFDVDFLRDHFVQEWRSDLGDLQLCDQGARGKGAGERSRSENRLLLAPDAAQAYERASRDT